MMVKGLGNYDVTESVERKKIMKGKNLVFCPHFNISKRG